MNYGQLKLIALLTTAAALAVPSLLLSAGARENAKKNGFVRRNGSIYYYKYGQLLRSAWLTVNGERRYYARSDGRLAVGRIRINGIKYEFDNTGKLMKEEII